MKKKLLFLTSSMGLGGIEKCLVAVVNNLDKEKYDIEVCIKNGDEIEYVKKIRSQVKITYLKTNNEIELLNSSKNYLIKKIRKIKNKMLENKRLKERLKENDIIIDFYDGNFYKKLKKIDKEKICFFHVKIDKLDMYKKNKIKEVLSSYNTYCTVSKGLAEEFKDLTKEECESIYNLFDLNEIKLKSTDNTSLNIKEKNMILEDYFFAASRLENEQKDLITLTKGYKNFYKKSKTKTKLYIAGTGPFEKELKEWIKKLELEEEIILLGFQENPYIWMKNSKAFILSSKYEGFGNVLIEAMACKTPVISTNCPYGPSELIEHNKNGLLIKVEDYKELGNSMMKVLENKKLREQLIANGLEKSKEFDIKKINKSYEILLKEK